MILLSILAEMCIIVARSEIFLLRYNLQEKEKNFEELISRKPVRIVYVVYFILAFY